MFGGNTGICSNEGHSMSRPPIWPDEEVEEARRLHDERPEWWDRKRLAEWFGCDRRTIYDWLNYRSRVGGKGNA